MPVYINKFICDHVSRENAANNRSRIQSKKKKNSCLKKIRFI